MVALKRLIIHIYIYKYIDALKSTKRGATLAYEKYPNKEPKREQNQFKFSLSRKSKKRCSDVEGQAILSHLYKDCRNRYFN